ncbi:MAG: FAD-dependent monooxygenase [Myxococcota bacterium]|nr:FAD-dependent monooxygenase [Deltaproteobacteria bacterium]MDQ3333682.1 FAD-dependent monooxygenase [Myxococcota bacterium]
MMLAIAVVGAGTAGAAAATLLARARHTVTVFERVAEPRPVGAGITLQPTGQVALARLGILDAIAARAARIDRLTAVRANGKPLIDLWYGDVDPRLYGLGTHRGVLFETLLGALQGEAVKLRFGIAIAGTDTNAQGRWLVDKQGHRYGPFDLVVAADGSTSELHSAAPLLYDRPYSWGAAWIVADDPGFAAENRIWQIVDGCHTLLGFLPTGSGPGRETPVVSMFWSMRVDRVEAWRAAGIGAWRDRVLRLEPRAEPILDTVDDLASVVFTRYRDVSMDPWHGDRIVFLGDCAHAMSPQLGQGANLALVDAVALADALAAHEAVPGALAAYSAARRRHLAFYQFMTRALTPLFQGDSRVLGWLRDRTFPISRWLRFVRYRMTRAMVGIDRGIIRRPFPVGEIVRQLPELPAADPAPPRVRTIDT